MSIALFDPLTIRGVRLRNRIVVSPMCQYSSTDGHANDWHVVHLGTRAVGGAGLVFTEAAAVVAEGRISPQDLGIWSDAHIEGLQRAVNVITSNGAVAGIQLAHAGRKASVARPWEGGRQLALDAGGWPVVAPSEAPFREGDRPSAALTRPGIEALVAAFVAAARRAQAAGFEVIEVHAAHGYLLHEFQSPLSNHRTDEYGGSFENRIRLTCDVVRALRAEWPTGRPLFVRISATDWTEGGWDIAQSVKLSQALKSLGVDLIDASTGGNVQHATIPTAPGYQVPFAAQIRREAGIATGAVGLITSPEQAESILTAGDADLIFLARELLRNPYWPMQAAKSLDVEPQWPVQYARAAG